MSNAKRSNAENSTHHQSRSAGKQQSVQNRQEGNEDEGEVEKQVEELTAQVEYLEAVLSMQNRARESDQGAISTSTTTTTTPHIRAPANSGDDGLSRESGNSVPASLVSMSYPTVPEKSPNNLSRKRGGESEEAVSSSASSKRTKKRKKEESEEHQNQHEQSQQHQRHSETRTENSSAQHSGKTEEFQVEKKKRFTWSNELHRLFISSIFDIGLTHSSPKNVLDMMLKNGASQVKPEHIKSHLQKYRANSKFTRESFMNQYLASTTMNHDNEFSSSALTPGFQSIPAGDYPISHLPEEHEGGGNDNNNGEEHHNNQAQRQMAASKASTIATDAQTINRLGFHPRQAVPPGMHPMYPNSLGGRMMFSNGMAWRGPPNFFPMQPGARHRQFIQQQQLGAAIARGSISFDEVAQGGRGESSILTSMERQKQLLSHVRTLENAERNKILTSPSATNATSNGEPAVLSGDSSAASAVVSSANTGAAAAPGTIVETRTRLNSFLQSPSLLHNNDEEQITEELFWFLED